VRYAGGPWGLTDPTTLRALATGAGFTDVRIQTLSRPVTFDAPAQLVSTVAVSPLAAELTAAAPDAWDRLVAAVAATVGDGPIESELEAHLLLARR
jgi:hypothetical protein